MKLRIASEIYLTNCCFYSCSHRNYWQLIKELQTLLKQPYSTSYKVISLLFSAATHLCIKTFPWANCVGIWYNWHLDYIILVDPFLLQYSKVLKTFQNEHRVFSEYSKNKHLRVSRNQVKAKLTSSFLENQNSTVLTPKINHPRKSTKPQRNKNTEEL